ncbi:hypothetical protein ACOTV5_02310 [Aliarcobacter butzleri]|uniref:hypothetical protein n=1 Tax=Aliarcobacter butzleri TaxID=28197 RepID=UPI003AFA44CA
MPSILEKALPGVLIFLATVIVCLGVYSRVLYTDNKDLITTINTLNSKIAVKEVEKVGLENSIKSQNIEIEKVSINLDEKMKELEEWKNKPPDIRYQEVIKIKEIKSNECTDIKTVINSFRSTSF